MGFVELHDQEFMTKAQKSDLVDAITGLILHVEKVQNTRITEGDFQRLLVGPIKEHHKKFYPISKGSNGEMKYKKKGKGWFGSLGNVSKEETRTVYKADRFVQKCNKTIMQIDFVVNDEASRYNLSHWHNRFYMRTWKGEQRWEMKLKGITLYPETVKIMKAKKRAQWRADLEKHFGIRATQNGE